MSHSLNDGIPPLSEQRLRQIAYQAWLTRGSPTGSPEVDWQFALDYAAQLVNSASNDTPPVDENNDDGSVVEVLTLGLDQ
jgi:hypothetical protein